MPDKLTRNVTIDPARTALLFVEVQNYAAHPDGGEFKALSPSQMAKYDYYFQRLKDVALPNQERPEASVRAIKGYCRQLGTKALADELGAAR